MRPRRRGAAGRQLAPEHEKMGFHEGRTQVTEQLVELVAKL
jgi:hypothetical protein